MLKNKFSNNVLQQQQEEIQKNESEQNSFQKGFHKEFLETMSKVKVEKSQEIDILHKSLTDKGMKDKQATKEVTKLLKKSIMQQMFMSLIEEQQQNEVEDSTSIH